MFNSLDLSRCYRDHSYHFNLLLTSYVSLLKPNFVRDIFERVLEAFKRTHAHMRNDHSRCDQFRVRPHAFESRCGSYNKRDSAEDFLLRLIRCNYMLWFVVSLSGDPLQKSDGITAVGMCMLMDV